MVNTAIPLGPMPGIFKGANKMSNDSERLRNFLLFKMYMTDKEMEEAAPWIIGTVIVIALLFCLFFFIV